jgi:hypothetical protein
MDKNRFLYIITGNNCQLYGYTRFSQDRSLYAERHFTTTRLSKKFRSLNTFLCCFPEFTTQSILTRVTNIGSPLDDPKKQLQIELGRNGEPVSFIIKIIQQLCDGKEIYLYGHSYGGLIVNRICEEIQLCITDEQYAMEYYELTKNEIKVLKKKYKKLQAATFGSIYIPKKQKMVNINIINYMYIGDLSIRSNFYELTTDSNNNRIKLPSHDDLDRNFLCNNNSLLLRYNSKRITNTDYDVIYLNKYVYDPNNNTYKPVVTGRLNPDLNPFTMMSTYDSQLDQHSRYRELLSYLINHPTIDIRKLQKCPKGVIQLYEPKEGDEPKKKTLQRIQQKIKGKKTRKNVKM